MNSSTGDIHSTINEFCLKYKNEILDWGYTEESESKSYNLFMDWVNQGKAGPLNYLKDERAQTREDLRHFFPQFKSSLVFLFSYQKEKWEMEEFLNSSENSNGLKLGSYVLGFEGMDYHLKLRERLSEFRDLILSHSPDMEVSFSLDTQPVLERDLAYRAGLGWFGKNSMLLHRKHGSYFIIASLLLSEKLELNPPLEFELDHCGQCTRCLDACPTQALDLETRTMDASLCISTFTIETFKDEGSPPEGYGKNSKEFFGCDICQEVCPWNQKPLFKFEEEKCENLLEQEGQLLIKNFFLQRPISEIISDLENMSNRGFRKIFKGTPLERTGRVGLLKNLRPFLNQ